MLQICLFKEEQGASSFLSKTAPDARVVRFWVCQSKRLTDGHVLIPGDGRQARVLINWTTRDTEENIRVRAAYDERIWRDSAGLSEWDDARVADLLADLGIVAADGQAAEDAFADALVGPVRAAERAQNQRLNIQWDIDGRDPSVAIDARNQIVAKAEAILNDAGLLVDCEGNSVDEATVGTTLAVTEFGAAKAVLWNSLSDAERSHNCRILDGSRMN